MKKTLTIVALSLVALIIVTTITLGFINTNFDQLSVDKAVSVKIYKNGSYQTFYKNNDPANSTGYNDVTKLYNNQSKISILAALFTGAYSAKASITAENTTMANKTSSGYWVSYIFDEAQTLKLNGKDYYDSGTTSDDPVSFVQMYLQVTETKGMELVYCYICETSNAVQARYTLTIYADQADLYDYINDLTVI